MRSNTWLLCAAAFVVAGCGGDSTTGPTVGTSGSLGFTFTGAGTNSSATFNASGAIPANPSTSFGTTAWAGGSTETANELDIGAAIPRSATTWDLAVITTPAQATGTFTINTSCTASSCPAVGYLVGVTQNEQAYTYICFLTTGTITVSSFSSTHATGTFSGTGSCVTQAQAVSSFAITNGTFDVGLAHVAFGRATKFTVPLR
jgi:hypothetical protein